ncbi:MAG: squalene--hopene cyclase [Planctomycetaceae bacterium]|jgi:squalene-hopene/tetraprenyl-beta-curcumene cyclase|nr:squalene--hopene cyclase [Planctomycetaceae bacterium]
MTGSFESTIIPERVQTALETAKRELWNRRTPEGCWLGCLSASALSTASAVSAISIFRNSHRIGHHQGRWYLKRSHPKNTQLMITPNESKYFDVLIRQGIDWLVAHQNPDGGWGDTVKSKSNVSTTLLVKSAFILSDVNFEDQDSLDLPNKISPVEHNTMLIGWSMDVLSRADRYLRHAGGVDAVRRRYGKDQTFSVPILTNAALAGLVPWKDVPQLPFERAILPHFLFRFLNLQVVSYAIPALVAIGQVRFHHGSEKNTPVLSFFRRRAIIPTLRLIERMQPESGGYLEAAPLTAFVVMSLLACGYLDHPIVVSGLRFLINSVREDGSWAIDSNLSTWLTSLAVTAIRPDSCEETLNWLLSCQHQIRHPFTGAFPGGWGWTNLSGAVPDGDDTSGALLALAHLLTTIPNTLEGNAKRQKIFRAAFSGIRWLLGIQNADGGIPTFCRGWGMLPFDQSSTDLTAHAIRACTAWQQILKDTRITTHIAHSAHLLKIMEPAINKMFDFLLKSQNSDGSWFPLWFGNQHLRNDVNPFYGTAKVLRAMRFTNRFHESVFRGLRWVVNNQNADGGWGSAGSTTENTPISSVEETAVILESLAFFANEPEFAESYRRGLIWLIETVESGHWLEPSPIGLYFAKLWYYEELYPIIFTVSALRLATDVLAGRNLPE